MPPRWTSAGSPLYLPGGSPSVAAASVLGVEFSRFRSVASSGPRMPCCPVRSPAPPRAAGIDRRHRSGAHGPGRRATSRGRARHADCTILLGERLRGSRRSWRRSPAYGLGVEGGSTGARPETFASESPLHEWLTPCVARGRASGGYFVRAETMHGLFSYLSPIGREPVESRPGVPHALRTASPSVALLGSGQFAKDGFFVMDRPEAGLSFRPSCTGRRARRRGSPAARSGARRRALALSSRPSRGRGCWSLAGHGIRESRWEDLGSSWTTIAASSPPRSTSRHVIDDPF